MIRAWCAALAIAIAGTANSWAAPQGGSAAALRASYTALQPELERSPFGKPLYLVSTETGDRLKGDIHALIEQPFEKVRSGLSSVQSWCDVLLLHPNISDCHASSDGKSITLSVGRQGTPAEFAFDLAASRSDYFDVRL